MNERFEQMMLKATKDMPQGYYVPPQYWEKFAELLVRECAGIVDNKIEVSRYVHEAELLRECSTTIKLHFGVEE